jgi:hypothetical protein
MIAAAAHQHHHHHTHLSSSVIAYNPIGAEQCMHSLRIMIRALDWARMTDVVGTSSKIVSIGGKMLTEGEEVWPDVVKAISDLGSVGRTCNAVKEPP